MDKKVTVVGAGFVGSTTARRIVEKDIADVVLFDIVEGLPQGKALDIMESSSLEGFNAKIIGTNDYSQTKNSDLVIITAGVARKPGMSRDDLQLINAKVISDVVKNIAVMSPDTILIVVTNPLDVMSYLALKVSGFLPEKVIGMAGVLDSARYRYFIAQALGVSPSDIAACVLGGHGDSMVPMPRYSTIGGISLDQLMDSEKIQAINQRTRNGGAEIIGLLKTGSAYYAPSAAVAIMVKSILRDEKRVLPCSVYLKGQYGLNDIYCGVPVILSAEGVEKIIELDLTDQETQDLLKSSESVKKSIAKLHI